MKRFYKKAKKPESNIKVDASILMSICNQVITNSKDYLKSAEKTFYKGYIIIKNVNSTFDVFYNNNIPVFEDVLFVDIAKYLIDNSSSRYKCYQLRSFESRFMSAKNSNKYYSALAKQYKDNIYYKAMVTETYHKMMDSLENISLMLNKPILYI